MASNTEPVKKSLPPWVRHARSTPTAPDPEKSTPAAEPVGLLDAALSYARRGWPVFPCAPCTKIPLLSKKHGGHGVEDATTDVKQITEWWTKHPGANIALACGKESGVYVVDVDLDEEKGVNGWETMRELREEGKELPATMIQDTPRGGAHYIYKTDNPPRNRNNFKPEGCTKEKSGIDIRCDKYYIMLAPSVHPNKKVYKWRKSTTDLPLAEFPDFMRPAEKKVVRPWEVKKPRPKPIIKDSDTPIIERARLYLAECKAANQGAGGHDALLWASRAMVIGFGLSDSVALSLLWSEYNPRCIPPWDQNNPGDVKDFERKVYEVTNTPSTKPRGWLLDDYGLRGEDPALMAIGQRIQAALLASAESGSDWEPFPLECLPDSIATFIREVSLSHNVDPVAVALPVLAVIAAAAGTAFRLELKDGFRVPPTLWVVLVAPTGSNKSGPLEAVIAPMWDAPPLADDGIISQLTQSEWVICDVTVEAVIPKLANCERGLLLNGEELSQWLESFDAYKTSKGGDQAKWIRLYDVKRYSMDRKTNGEHVDLRAPSVCIAGAIQPEMLSKAAKPEALASGFLARALVAMPPTKKRVWNDEGVSPLLVKFWQDIVDKIRIRPFASFTDDSGSYEPNIVCLSSEAYVEYKGCYKRVAERVHESTGIERIISAKSDTHTARLALVLHVVKCALGQEEWDAPLSGETMKAAICLGEWFLNETLRVFQCICFTAQTERRTKLVAQVEKSGGTLSVRALQRSNSNLYPTADAARSALRDLSKAGLGKMKDDKLII